MDPKEYLPYLEKLRHIGDEVERRYQICTDLKNWEGAVEVLAQVFFGFILFYFFH